MINRFTIIAFITMLFVACGPEPTPILPESVITPTLEQLPTATIEPTVTVTPLPTEVPRDFTTYTHPTGVFTITLPNDWEALDASTDRRLQTRLVPPPGYGSRVTIEVTNEGLLEGNAVQAEFEQALRFYTVEQGNSAYYTEQSRSTDETSTLYEATFAYNDGRGGQGTERFIGRQNGPYFVLMRLFLADEDTFTLSTALDTIANGLAVDTQAGWGSSVAAINPAELPIINTLLWQDDEDITYWAGQVQNNSPTTVSNLRITVSVCSESGVVLTEFTEPMIISRIGQGATIPFGFSFEDLPDDVEICQQSVTGVPAQPDPTRTNGLSINVSADTAGGIELLLEGTVVNNTLSPVTDVNLVLAVFDETGAVVGYRVINFGFDNILQPGDAVEFREVFDDLGGSAASYVLYNEAVVLRETSPVLEP